MESPGTYPTLQEGFALEVTPQVGGSVDDRAGVVVTLVFANRMRAAFMAADWVRPDDGPFAWVGRRNLMGSSSWDDFMYGDAIMKSKTLSF